MRGRLCQEIARYVPNIAKPKNSVDKRPLFFGPIFSTKLPRKHVVMPRKRMAVENTPVVSESVMPISAMIGRVRTLQA